MSSDQRQYGIFMGCTGDVFVGQSIESSSSSSPPPMRRRSSTVSRRFDFFSGCEGPVDAPRAIYWQLPACRDGWGVWLHTTERYEGEWERNERHGLGCINNRRSDRYIGQFEDGCKSGLGVSISSSGELHAELWDADKLLQRSLVFQNAVEDGKVMECNAQSHGLITNGHNAVSVQMEKEILDEDEGQIERRTPTKDSALCDGQEGISTRYSTSPIVDHGVSTNGVSERSNAEAMDSWSVDEVAELLSAIGLDPSFVEQLRAHRVSGVVLSTLTSSAAIPFLESTFGAFKPNPPWRVLVLFVELLLKLKKKLSSSRISDAEFMERFGELEIADGELTFDKSIGEGGYATVYKARWMHTNVAAKVLRATEASRLTRELYSELNVLQSLRHPNITLLIGFCLRPSSLIVTELVDGPSLFKWLHRSRRSPDWNLSRVICIAREICLGMVYLHANNVVHCDLKSSNVLLSKSFDVKLCDFGLSHRLAETLLPDLLSVNIGAVGTHQWMAPEVLKGEGYSTAADIYSFGMILWEMISRQVPFQGYSATQITALVGYGNRRPRLPEDCPEPLRKILQKALLPRPCSRKSFRELADDLAKLHRSFIIDVEESLWTFFLG